MIFSARHLAEERLFECYQGARRGEAMDPPAAEHLADCSDCRARYADLQRFMDALRSQADAEIDDLFSPEQARVQQQQIARRIEQLVHPARILSFPGHPPERQAAGPRTSVAPRWLAAAAAAGLLIGVAARTTFLPEMVQAPGRLLPAEPAAATLAANPAPAPIPSNREVAVFADSDFLSRLELSLERPRTAELLALDELTPHVREIGYAGSLAR